MNYSFDWLKTLLVALWQKILYPGVNQIDQKPVFGITIRNHREAKSGQTTSFILFMGERKLGADHFKARKSIFVVAKQPSLFIHETRSSLPTTLVGKKWRVRVHKIDIDCPTLSGHIMLCQYSTSCLSLKFSCTGTGDYAD